MKARSKATVNPSGSQLIPRHVGRIKTLRSAIAKAESKGQLERVASLNEELSRRLSDINELKKELDNL